MKRLVYLLGTLLVVSCGAVLGSKHYYVVRDLSGGEVYFTNDLE